MERVRNVELLSRLVARDTYRNDSESATIGGPIQFVVSYRDQCALLHTLLYKYPKAGNSFTVIN